METEIHAETNVNPSDASQPSPADRPPQDASAQPVANAPRSMKRCEHPEGRCQMCEIMSAVRVLRSDELLQSGREVLILHENEVYRLLRTRNNKLILHK